MLCLTAVKLVKEQKKSLFTYIILASAALLSFFLNISPVYIVLCALAVGVARFILTARKVHRDE
jgi:uncharacterized membrane protein